MVTSDLVYQQGIRKDFSKAREQATRSVSNVLMQENGVEGMHTE
jgi:hypothetical protein